MTAFGALGQNQVTGPVTAGSTERAVFFSGKVTLEDGSAPPSQVGMQKVCGGQTTFVTLTDSTGHFSFKVDNGGTGTGTADAGQAVGQPADLNKPWGSASQYSSPITSALRGCQLEAVLPGFRADRVSMALKSTMDDARLGTIILHPLSKASSLTVSTTTLQAPSSAIRTYEKGLVAVKAQKWDAAGREFAAAVKIYPEFAVAWYELGVVRQSQDDVAGAHEAWKEASERDPKYLQPLEALTVLADRQQNWAEEQKYSHDWIQLDPDDFPAAFLFNAIANARLSQMTEAERSARAGLAIDKEHRLPRLSYVLGLILLQKPDYGESAKCFRVYLEMAPNARDAAAVRLQLAALDKTTSSTPSQ
jgi:TolA-binding protein